jgi:Domain of Unknown Function (DUF1080).
MIAVGSTVWAADSAELRPIFNGRDFEGWVLPEPNLHWRVEEGVIVGVSDEARKGSVLRTEKSYRDFVLEFEARWSKGADSGIFLRKPELQMQLGISISRKIDLSGSFYVGGKDPYPENGRAAIAGRLRGEGEWNKFRLEAKGDTFTVWLNDERVGRFIDARYAEAAPIGLQVHQNLAMKVEFRNLRARALE